MPICVCHMCAILCAIIHCITKHIFKSNVKSLPQLKHSNLMFKYMPLEVYICVQFYVPLSTLSLNTLYKLMYTYSKQMSNVTPMTKRIYNLSLVKIVKIVEHNCFLLGIWSQVILCTLVNVSSIVHKPIVELLKHSPTSLCLVMGMSIIVLKA